MDLQAITYMTIPYLENGQDRAGIDCYGLCQLWYAEQLGIVLGNYGYDRTLPHRAQFRGNRSPFADCVDEDFYRVQEPQRHDLVLIRNKFKRKIDHIGVVLGPNNFIHALEGVGVSAPRLSAWADRIVSFHRHRSK
jgi:cell wall-associated NlpC family hydrolase